MPPPFHGQEYVGGPLLDVITDQQKMPLVQVHKHCRTHHLPWPLSQAPSRLWRGAWLDGWGGFRLGSARRCSIPTDWKGARGLTRAGQGCGVKLPLACSCEVAGMGMRMGACTHTKGNRMALVNQ